MYLSYFRDHVWGLGSLGRGTASSLMSSCHGRQTSLGSAVQDQKWEKGGDGKEVAQVWLCQDNLEIHWSLQLKNHEIETYWHHSWGGGPPTGKPSGEADSSPRASVKWGLTKHQGLPRSQSEKPGGYSTAKPSGWNNFHIELMPCSPVTLCNISDIQWLRFPSQIEADPAGPEHPSQPQVICQHTEYPARLLGGPVWTSSFYFF